MAEPGNQTNSKRPPFLGSRRVKGIDLNELFNEINTNALFRFSWGIRNAAAEKWEKYSGQFKGMLKEFQEKISVEPWMEPAALYGFWPCNADNNELVIYESAPARGNEIMRFRFPRQKGKDLMCLSDYFASASTDKTDIVAFQIVTLGTKPVDYIHDLQNKGDITEAFYAHGLAVQLTEAAARYTHSIIRRDMGLPDGGSKRYSWGFPALPDLSQHELLFRLLPAEKELGIRLTSAYQFVPEFTTAAMIIHHPNARYFRIE